MLPVATHGAHAALDRIAAPPRRHGRGAYVAWALAPALLGALVAWLVTDALRLPRDLFVAAHAALTALLVGGYVAWARVDPFVAMTRAPWRTVAATVIVGAIAVRSVLAQRGAPPSEGARLAFELVWDGIVYGAADGLLLTVLPMAAMRAAAGAKAHGARGIAIALGASLVAFAAYHLGFAEFRGPDLVWPVLAGVLFGAAYVASDNPLAPVLAHVAMHVAAVLHGPAGTLQLPPHT